MSNLLVRVAAAAATFLTISVPAMAVEQARPGAAVTRVDLQQRVQARFAKLDADSDGAITRAEFEAQRARQRTERRGAAFAMLDADRSGQISRDEFLIGGDRRGGRKEAGKPSRDHADARSLHGRAHGGRTGGFARLDADGDGRVTLAEVSARPLARFDAADTNKDGQVTPEERKAARDARQAKRG